jgi:hypothetical protein
MQRRKLGRKADNWQKLLQIIKALIVESVVVNNEEIDIVSYAE